MSRGAGIGFGNYVMRKLWGGTVAVDKLIFSILLLFCFAAVPKSGVHRCAFHPVVLHGSRLSMAWGTIVTAHRIMRTHHGSSSILWPMAVGATVDLFWVPVGRH
jgi:hypothetical protein